MSGYDDKAATEVEITWTNQHGTGKKADHFVESQVIVQYMCQAFPDGEVPLTNINTQFEHHTIRNGGTSSTQTFRANQRESSDVKLTLGLHEPYNYYQSYLRRERNKGRMFNFRPGEEGVCVCVCVCGGGGGCLQQIFIQGGFVLRSSHLALLREFFVYLLFTNGTPFTYQV